MDEIYLIIWKDGRIEKTASMEDDSLIQHFHDGDLRIINMDYGEVYDGDWNITPIPVYKRN